MATENGLKPLGIALRRPARRIAALRRTVLREKLVLFWATILFVELLAVVTSFILGADADQIHLRDRLARPAFGVGDSGHFLGTDSLGRDVLLRIFYGTRISLAVGLGGALGAALVGITAGLTSGYFGGWVDTIIMRLVDIQLSFPPILLALSIIAVLGGGLGNLILVLIIGGWVAMARVVRGQTLSLREFPFVEAAQSIGASAPRIMLRHILPNTIAPIIVLFSFSVASFIVIEATLSFLGLGLPPTVPSWGTMIAQGRPFLRIAWWISTFAGLALMITVLSINMIGDWLRDRLDPRLRSL